MILKKNKFPNGGLVYIIDYCDEDKNVDGIFRLGKTDNGKEESKILFSSLLLEVMKVGLSPPPI